MSGSARVRRELARYAETAPLPDTEKVAVIHLRRYSRAFPRVRLDKGRYTDVAQGRWYEFDVPGEAVLTCYVTDWFFGFASVAAVVVHPGDRIAYRQASTRVWFDYLFETRVLRRPPVVWRLQADGSWVVLDQVPSPKPRRGWLSRDL